MAGTYKILTADNAQIADSIGDLYTSSVTTCYLKAILLFNTNTTTETILLYIANNGTGGAANQFFTIALATKESRLIEFSNPIPLVSGAKLCGATTVASKVNVLAWGREDS